MPTPLIDFESCGNGRPPQSGTDGCGGGSSSSEGSAVAENVKVQFYAGEIPFQVNPRYKLEAEILATECVTRNKREP